MAKAKRVEPKLKKPVLAYQQRFDRELLEIRQDVAFSTAKVEEAMKMTLTCFQKLLDKYTEVVSRCDGLHEGMRKEVRRISSQPPTEPPAKA